MTSLQIPPITALNAQLDAMSMVQKVSAFAAQQATNPDGPEQWRHRASAWYDLDWTNDIICLKAADPFLWATDPIRACLQASQSLPMDTTLSYANLPQKAAWWYFEEPLPIPTTDSRSNIRALALGWFTSKKGRYFRISVWNDEQVLQPYALAPSQIWTWLEGETLGQMMTRVCGSHEVLYGTGGRYENVAVKEDVFLQATERVSRFVLAATAWLEQRVVTEDRPHIERHRRKEFTRVMNRPPSLRVVHLRKREAHDSSSEHTGEPHKVEWTHQWTVDGHWRNQPHGPQHRERKLTWIFPFVKGPSDKPFKQRVPKVYEVSR
jgi:hypothetical protein